MFHSLLKSLFQVTSSVILDSLKLALVKNGIWKLGMLTATRLHLEKGMAIHSSIHSCLENPMDREAWQTTVLGVAKNQTGLSY